MVESVADFVVEESGVGVDEFLTGNLHLVALHDEAIKGGLDMKCHWFETIYEVRLCRRQLVEEDHDRVRHNVGMHFGGKRLTVTGGTWGSLLNRTLRYLVLSAKNPECQSEEWEAKKY